MAATRPWCALCRVHYRNAAHFATQGHKRRAFRAANPRTKATTARRERIRAAVRQAHRSQAAHDEAVRRRVRRHRRRRPDDGPARSVRVSGYWQRKPPPLFRDLRKVADRWYSVAFGIDGKARSLRPATRREVRQGGYQ
jgi:hypothetical protein